MIGTPHYTLRMGNWVTRFPIRALPRVQIIMLIFMPNKKSRNQKRPNPVGTPQGRNTLISLLICTILAMVLSWGLPVLLEKLQPGIKPEKAQEIGVFVALGISGVVLVVRLLKPRKSVSPLRRQLLKEQEKSDGR